MELRYYWNTSKINLGNIKETLSTQKQNLEDEIKLSCEKKKTDYEDSLSKAKEAMKKLGKCKRKENYPYDKHEEYCAGLKQIIEIYEQQQNIKTHGNKSNNLISPQQEESTISIDKILQ